MDTGCLFLASEAVAAGGWRSLAEQPLTWAVMLGAASIWLLLPGGRARGSKWLSAVVIVLGLVGAGLFGWQSVGTWVEDGVFFALALTTVASAAAAITSRSPVFSAVWFGMLLIGSAGLFLYLGAEFLSLATLVVYAGAILVTLLFVLMLAQTRANAYYDRITWEPLLSVATGAVMVGVLTGTVLHAFQLPTDEGPADGQPAVAAKQLPGPRDAADKENEQPTMAVQDKPGDSLRGRGGILAEEHVATLGAQLFSRYLIAVEAAGALLLAALVGAVAIVAQGKQMPAADEHSVAHGSSAHE